MSNFYAAIQTADGKHFLTANGGGGQTTNSIHTDATWHEEDEKFYFQDLNDNIGNLYAIKTHKEYYLTATDGGGMQNGDAIHTDARSIGPDEKFRLVPLDGNQYAIQTFNGNFMTANGGGGKNTDAIHTDVTWIRKDEKFRLFRNP